MAIRQVLGVEVLTVPSCRHRDMAVARLRRALDRVGASHLVVAERVIDDPAVAAAAGMHGSPTVLIDGRDPFVASGTEGSVSCRLYPTPAGYDGAPSVAELIIALHVPGHDEVVDGPGDREPGGGLASSMPGATHAAAFSESATMGQ